MSSSLSYSFIFTAGCFIGGLLKFLYLVLLIFIQFVVRDEFIFILTSVYVYYMKYSPHIKQ